MNIRTLLPFLALAVGCEPTTTADTLGERSAGGDVCTRARESVTLPAELPESSGVLISRRHPGVLWTHNDSWGGPFLFAVDTLGELIGRLRVEGAQNQDWEDISYGPCSDGSDCIWIGDVGDNDEERSVSTLYRISEPNPTDSVTGPAEAFHIRYPDGPRDVEALFLAPDGSPHLISKGRGGPVTVYRYPVPLSAVDTVTLEWVQDLTQTAPSFDRRVTAASITPSGSHVAVRTYLDLQFYVLEADTLRPLLPARGVELLPLREPQGEGIDLTDQGRVVLTSEEALSGMLGPMNFLDCRLP